jgi:WASH complex subunit strumpellin
MQYSLENLFTFEEGKQLICEAFYMFGVMLLLMDHLIEGPVRERIVLCYYRNKGGENISNISKVIKLVADTEFRPSEKRAANYVRPSNYPEDLFARYPFESKHEANTEDVMESVILAIKDDDIYKQMPAYPQAKYRSFALANQSSMLFVLLFFMPDVLNRAKSTMREVVDKHFYNTWVIPFYLGYIVDLTEWWKPYKAAKAALNNILDLESIQELVTYFTAKQAECYEKCTEYLAEGVMTDEYVTYNLNTMMNCVRDSNVALRWLILHRNTVHDKIKEVVHASSNDIGLLRLMLVCSEFETILKERITHLLGEKETLWNDDRTACSERLQELSDYYGRAQALGKLEADDSLKSWFEDMSEGVGNISYSNSTYATRKIQAFIKALEDIEEYNQVGSRIQVKTYLQDTRRDLDHMVKIVNIKNSTLTHIEIISDITWSWIALKSYIRLMQKEIRKSPNIALLLKSTFMKLSSILNIPMVRMISAQSPDIDSVSKFYSNELIKIVKDVLQIIPELVFENLDGIISIFLTKMATEPHKFDKAELTKYSQFPQRLDISKLTN